MLLSCLVLFDAIVELSLSYMLWMKKWSITFSLENESGFLSIVKEYLIHALQYVYVVESHKMK